MVYLYKCSFLKIVLIILIVIVERILVLRGNLGFGGWFVWIGKNY